MSSTLAANQRSATTTVLVTLFASAVLWRVVHPLAAHSGLSARAARKAVWKATKKERKAVQNNQPKPKVAKAAAPKRPAAADNAEMGATDATLPPWSRIDFDDPVLAPHSLSVEEQQPGAFLYVLGGRFRGRKGS